MIELSDQWKALIQTAWLPDVDIFKWLPEVVRAIKATRSSAEAETALFTLFRSPLVQGDSLRLVTPGIVTPEYLARNDYADAAGHPYGRRRNEALAEIRAATKGAFIPVSQIVGALKHMPKDPITKKDKGAAKQRDKRARRVLGISRKNGRPKKGDKNLD